ALSSGGGAPRAVKKVDLLLKSPLSFERIQTILQLRRVRQRRQAGPERLNRERGLRQAHVHVGEREMRRHESRVHERGAPPRGDRLPVVAGAMESPSQEKGARAEFRIAVD